MTGSARAPALLLALALLGTAVAYGAGLDGDFHLDDWSSVRGNLRIRSLDRALDVAPLDLLGPARPVADLSFALDYARGALDPSAYHLTSLLLHLLTALLVWRLALDVLRRAGHPRAPWLAALAAAAFALHPIQAESVAYATQRAEVLSALLGLGALLTLLAAEAAWPRPRAAALAAGATALMLLALGAKAVAVVVPAAFLWHRLALPGLPGADHAPSPSPARPRLAAALALAAVPLLLTLAAVARNLAVLDRPGLSAGLSAGTLGPWRYLLTQLKVHWTYLALMAWPSGLSVDHGDYPPSPATPDAATLAAGLALLALLAAAAWAWREAGRRPGLAWARVAAFGLGWWLLWLAPTSSVVPIVDLVAEHRTYLASAGLLLALVTAGDAALTRASPGLPGRDALAVAAALLAALGVALGLRVQVWRSDWALWTDAVRKSPASFRAAVNLAFAEHAAGRAAAAKAGYERAASLAATPGERAEVARNRAALALDQGDAAAALAAADEGLAVSHADAALHNNRSIALSDLGRLDEAVVAARRAVAIAPGQPDYRSTLGLNLRALGRLDEAAEAFRLAAGLDPGDPRLAEQALVTLHEAGRRAEACEVARQARRIASAPTTLRAAIARVACP